MAAVALAVAVVGVPVLLLVVATPDLSSWAGRSWLEVLFRRDDGSALLLVLAAAAWLVWGLFTLCVVVELINVLARRSRPIRLPGLGPAQGVAAALVLAVVAAVLAPAALGPATGSGAQPPSSSRAPAAASVDRGVADPGAAGAEVPGEAASDRTGTSAHQGGAGAVARGGTAGATSFVADPRIRADILAVHRVAAGDDLWSLAEQYYGDGSTWRQIALANAVLATHGPDDLEVGWRLVIPAQRAAAGPYVVAVPGDTLSGLAARHLGGPDHWPDLYEANRAVLSDPDDLEIGTVLQLPGEGRFAPDPAAAAERPAGTVTAGSAGASQPGSSAGNDAPAETAPSPAVSTSVPGDPVLQLAGISGMVAAAIVGGLATRRLHQLRERPLGRRISQPPPSAVRAGQELAVRQRPDRMAAVDRAMRLVAGWSRTRSGPIPRLLSVRVGATLAFELAQVTETAPAPFRVAGRVWEIEDVAGWLASDDPYPDEGRPWPATVTVGTVADGSEVLVNLEEVGVLGVCGTGALAESRDPTVRSALLALAAALSFQPWSAGTRITVVADAAEAEDLAWAAALDAPDLSVTDDVDAVLDRLHRRAEEQRTSSGGAGAGEGTDDGSHETDLEAGPQDRRLDPDCGAAWAADVVVLLTEPTPSQRSRLIRVVAEEDHVISLAAIVPGRDGAAARLELDGDGARLSPAGLACQPQLVDPATAEHLAGLLAGTAGPTTPAPWWSGVPVSYHARRATGGGEDDPTASVLGLPPAHAVAGPSGSGPGTLAVGDNERARAAGNAAPTTNQEAIVSTDDASTHLSPADPVVLLIGPIDLVGARGVEPTRARKQCIEYCAWLLEHPGRTAAAMADALVVAEGTRRSNMSRLRSWLGDGVDGPYLPDAYSGRISLHDSVSSDWQRLQLLVAGGVDRASTSALAAALDLVRGAPLADAAPLQWMWAEELRTDIISIVRDIGVELSARALADGDRDLARWAAARALTAAAGDELLQCARIRVEHAAGNQVEVERLALQLAAQARRLEVDLADSTVALLQQVMEGGIRTRIATPSRTAR